MIKNAKVYATKEWGDKMDIYLDCSGERIYLMPHRFDPTLYQMMKDGIRLSGLKRCQNMYKLQGRKTYTERRRSRVLENSIKHLVNVVDEYLEFEYDAELDAA